MLAAHNVSSATEEGLTEEIRAPAGAPVPPAAAAPSGTAEEPAREDLPAAVPSADLARVQSMFQGSDAEECESEEELHSQRGEGDGLADAIPQLGGEVTPKVLSKQPLISDIFSKRDRERDGAEDSGQPAKKPRVKSSDKAKAKAQAEAKSKSKETEEAKGGKKQRPKRESKGKKGAPEVPEAMPAGGSEPQAKKRLPGKSASP